MRKRFASSLALGLLAAYSSLAQAAPICGPREKIIEALGQKYQENRKAMGVTGEAAVVELFVSGEGTWTITASTAQGQTCVIAAGEAWQAARRQLAGLGS